ncbi:hypothetical protein OESDEN_18367 [Oesophagostomum dentatum]|uniref:Uncharacterized protein n=1 Tax=Oesophagostomum dentatum TaxID=61180 RepID=A0A0B1S9F9_OESDE|nr:hypothetical protein OESDEN_18367 [Oesophagostomum dentatum]
MNIRQKLAEQKRSIARRADMMMRRRIDGLQAVAGGTSASGSGALVGSTSVPTPPPDNKPFAGTHMKGGLPGPSPLSQVPSMSSMPTHPQPGQHPQQQRGFMSSGMMPPQQQQPQPGGMQPMGQGMPGGMGGPMGGSNMYNPMQQQQQQQQMGMMGGMRPGQHPGGQPMPPGAGRGAAGQPPPPYHHRAPTPMVGFNTNPSMMQPGMSMHPGMGQMRGRECIGYNFAGYWINRESNSTVLNPYFAVRRSTLW